MKSYLDNNVYDTIQNILFETNIFSILKLDSSEIRHTNMI